MAFLFKPDQRNTTRIWKEMNSNRNILKVRVLAPQMILIPFKIRIYWITCRIRIRTVFRSQICMLESIAQSSKQDQLLLNYLLRLRFYITEWLITISHRRIDQTIRVLTRKILRCLNSLSYKEWNFLEETSRSSQFRKTTLKWFLSTLN